MINPFQTGDQKFFSKRIAEQEIAQFDSGTVHAVYSTFFLAKDAEWSTRLFVLEMKEQNEEGIGTFIYIDHHSPALVGETIQFIATLLAVNGHEVICGFEARVNSRLVASGKTGQKILKKEKLERIFGQLNQG